MTQKQLVAVLLAMSFTRAAYAAATSTKSLDEMSLEELLDIEVSVATKTEQAARTVPGIVTVVTGEEISSSGARDLTDVLQLVPGFTLGVDVEGVTSLGVRGNWAQEGKVLLLWDGQEMNEGFYGNIALGNHFPVDQIKRIEIIRGPGSVIYGGFAELAVINVVTYDGEDLNGARAQALYTQTGGGYGRENLSASVGKRVGDASVSFSAFTGRMRRTDRDYTDANGSTYDLLENSMKPMMMNLGVKYKGFDFRAIVDQYRTDQSDAYGENFSAPVHTNFDGYYVGARYAARLGDRMTLTPYFSYKLQRPWQAKGPEPVIDEIEGVRFDVVDARLREGLLHSWDLTPNLSLLTGFEMFQEQATILTPQGGGDPIEYGFDDQVLFSQLVWMNEIVNLTVGARYDHHNVYKSALVPRVALTRRLGDWNFKFLVSRAYRSPTAANIDSNPQIRREFTTMTELEAGYRFNDAVFGSVNFFNTAIADPIIYSSDPVNNRDIFQNLDRAGTRGIELQLRMKEKWGYVDASYSTYTPISDSIPSYSVPGQTGSLLGMPNHKVATRATLATPVRDLKVSPSLVWLSSRSAYTGLDGDGNLVLARLGSVPLLNLFATYDDLVVKHLQVGAGVYNLLDRDYLLAQPYSPGTGSAPHPPMAAPGGGRELVARVSYSLPL